MRIYVSQQQYDFYQEALQSIGDAHASMPLGRVQLITRMCEEFNVSIKEASLLYKNINSCMEIVNNGSDEKSDDYVVPSHAGDNRPLLYADPRILAYAGEWVQGAGILPEGRSLFEALHLLTPTLRECMAQALARRFPHEPEGLLQAIAAQYPVGVLPRTGKQGDLQGIQRYIQHKIQIGVPPENVAIALLQSYPYWEEGDKAAMYVSLASLFYEQAESCMVKEERDRKKGA